MSDIDYFEEEDNMSQDAAPSINFAKFAGDTKSQVVSLTAMLLDIPPDHEAYAPLVAARTALEQAYAKLRTSVVPPNLSTANKRRW